MKIRFFWVAGALFLLSVVSSCHWHRHYHDVSIYINDDEDVYQLSARFDESKTVAIEKYLRQCTKSIDGSFKYNGNNHDYINANLILDDDTRVFVKSHYGRLKIKFNKEENSEAAYERVKDMCEGIKELLAKN